MKPMPRPRLTLRSLMIAVAIVSLLLVGGMWAERRKFLFEVKAITHRAAIGQYAPDSANARYHRAMDEKYGWASRYPWLPVVMPDPPPPPE